MASFIGTTGAAMLLIRPLLETNRERKHVQHTVVFFIFIVCNCGGLLSPLGDPPLFLGYLMGVPFLWTAGFWKEWLLVNGALLAIYYVWDHLWCYRREPMANIVRDETRVHRLRFGGLWPNGPLLLGVVLAMALLDPGKPIPGTDVASVALSARNGAAGAGGPVAGAGQRPLAPGEPLQLRTPFWKWRRCSSASSSACSRCSKSWPSRGRTWGSAEPWHYFWAAGGLSSVLDNAPTYVVFFQAGQIAD